MFHTLRGDSSVPSTALTLELCHEHSWYAVLGASFEWISKNTVHNEKAFLQCGFFGDSVEIHVDDNRKAEWTVAAVAVHEQLDLFSPNFINSSTRS